MRTQSLAWAVYHRMEKCQSTRARSVRQEQRSITNRTCGVELDLKTSWRHCRPVVKWCRQTAAMHGGHSATTEAAMKWASGEIPPPKFHTLSPQLALLFRPFAASRQQRGAHHASPHTPAWLQGSTAPSSPLFAHPPFCREAPHQNRTQGGPAREQLPRSSCP